MTTRGKARLIVIISDAPHIEATYKLELEVGTLRDLSFEGHEVTICLETVEIEGVEINK